MMCLPLLLTFLLCTQTSAFFFGNSGCGGQCGTCPKYECPTVPTTVACPTVPDVPVCQTSAPLAYPTQTSYGGGYAYPGVPAYPAPAAYPSQAYSVDYAPQPGILLQPNPPTYSNVLVGSEPVGPPIAPPLPPLTGHAPEIPKSSYQERLERPTLVPTPNFATEASGYFEGNSVAPTLSAGSDYEEAAPPPPTPIPYNLPGYVPATPTILVPASNYISDSSIVGMQDGEAHRYSLDEDDRIMAANTDSGKYNSEGQGPYETYARRHLLLKRMKSAKQLSSHTTVPRTNSTCNSSKLAKVMVRAMVGDVAIAKKMVQRATEVAFDGTKYDVFCANDEFSYSIHSRKYCEVTKEDVTCFAFR